MLVSLVVFLVIYVLRAVFYTAIGHYFMPVVLLLTIPARVLGETLTFIDVAFSSAVWGLLFMALFVWANPVKPGKNRTSACS